MPISAEPLPERAPETVNQLEIAPDGTVETLHAGDPELNFNESVAVVAGACAESGMVRLPGEADIAGALAAGP